MSTLPTGRGMVTSPHRLASEAGQAVLRRGGNAIDAAIAMGAVLSVTQPHFCGLGGDAVWLVADRDGRNRCFLGIGQAADAVKEIRELPIRGPGSTLTTAGAVDSWGHAHHFGRTHWGSSETIATLLAPAILLAEDGFELTPSQAHALARRAPEAATWPSFAPIFAPLGAAPRPGERFFQPELAGSLRAIARHGAREFYEGALAVSIAGSLTAAGSPITLADLQRTHTQEVDPLVLAFQGAALLAPPPPTQGAITLQILGMLERLRIAEVAENTDAFLHLCIEAVKQALLQRDIVADPDFSAVSLAQLLSREALLRKAAAVDRQRALPWPHQVQAADTVFFAAVDSAGRCASVLQSLYSDWGSGVVAGGTGILWHNRGAAFSLRDGHPNRLAPRKRPFHTLSPGMALDDGAPSLLYGTSGGDAQPQILAVLLARMLAHGMAPKDALARPRFVLGRSDCGTSDSVMIESGAGAMVIAHLANRGHAVAPIPVLSPLAGQAGILRIGADGAVDGAHDPRSDGVALLA